MSHLPRGHEFNFFNFRSREGQHESMHRSGRTTSRQHF